MHCTGGNWPVGEATLVSSNEWDSLEDEKLGDAASEGGLPSKFLLLGSTPLAIPLYTFAFIIYSKFHY